MATYDLTQNIPNTVNVGDVLNVPYSGSAVSMTLPAGRYKLEVWGAEGKTESFLGTPGKGGYSSGYLNLYANTLCYFLAGGTNGFNGGGEISEDYFAPYFEHASSGGGSDIRIGTNSYFYRAIVAGGGGCGGVNKNQPVGGNPEYLYGGYGGGTSGGNSQSLPNIGSATGGTQTSGGTGARDTTSSKGGFGQGKGSQGGGGGWYTGGGTRLTIFSDRTYWAQIWPSAGGSGYVFTAATASSAPQGFGLTSDYYLEPDTAVTKSGASSILLPDGTSSVGNTGNGYVRLTRVTPRLQSPTVTSVTEPVQGQTQISFSAVTGATGYKLYAQNGSLIGEYSSSPITVQNIDPSINYVWKLSATGTGYLESYPTTIEYSSKLKLSSPTNLKASYTANTTTITWNSVSGATSYIVKRNGTQIATVGSNKYVDNAAGAGVQNTYAIIATASGRWDSDSSTITTSNKPQLSNVTNLQADQTVSSVTLSWTAAQNALTYSIFRDGSLIGNTSSTSYIDNGTVPGTIYQYQIIANRPGYYSSTGTNITVQIRQQLDPPDLIEADQAETTVTLNWAERDYGTAITFTLSRNGSVIYQGRSKSFTDSGLIPRTTYTYSLIAAIPGSGYYDSEPTYLEVMTGRDYTTIERQKDYLKSLLRPFTKLCRLRFLNPNGTTAFALDNNPRNKRSRTFIASGSVTANMQNGKRYSATVTLDNTNLEYETAVNKIWFGQEIAIDEGLVLSNGEEYYRQTGVFVIDNPQEKFNPNDRTVTYNLLDKWAKLDGKLGGRLEGTYEVPVGTNIYTPILALLTENIGNGNPSDNTAPVFTEFYNERTQELPDGTVASMVLSPYTLTIDGENGTKASVILGLCEMVNAWVGYDNTGRLRIDPSQDDILDITKPVLWRFTPENSQFLGATYTVKKEDVYNDVIIVGEQLDDYLQPGGRATNYDARSDTNANLIGLRTMRESASGYSTVKQCMDLAEWKLKRASVLQKAVSISTTQMMHIDLNSIVEIVRTDKPGNPVERHLIIGYTRPLTYSGPMTISAVSVNDFPTATVSKWPPDEV